MHAHNDVVHANSFVEFDYLLSDVIGRSDKESILKDTLFDPSNGPIYERNEF